MSKPPALGSARKPRPPRGADAPDLVYRWLGDSVVFPDMQDLVACLRFRPADGRIWFGGERALMVRAALLTTLRRELMLVLGPEKVMGLFKRAGYAEGTRDAELARTLRGGDLLASDDDYFHTFAVGPQIHALSGFARVETVQMHAHPESGFFEGEFLLHDSVEADAHLTTLGLSPEPACWLGVGYASGYLSAFLGRPVLVQESECRGMGHAHCRLTGRPLEDWERDEHAEAPFFRPQSFVNRFPDAAPDPASDAAPATLDAVGISAGFSGALHLLGKAAPTNVTVLFLGETGVGKEVFARMLHRMGPRAQQPFVAVNCAALPENLVEAELFGVVKGAYTGASASRPGRFERADGGTLFLDEVGTLNLASQGKLLRALQEREIERVGDTCTRRVDVRVMAATNVDLKAAVQAGRFREDLYFRLTVFPVHIPPLRERRDDIPLLMRHFLRRFSVLHQREVVGFTGRALSALVGYDFPGNIRELENMIERGVILASPGEPLDLAHLFQGASHRPDTYTLSAAGTLADEHPVATQPATPDLAERLGTALGPLNGATSLAALQDTLVDLTLRACGGNRAQAARRLGLTRRQLDYRLRQRPAAPGQGSQDQTSSAS